MTLIFYIFFFRDSHHNSKRNPGGASAATRTDSEADCDVVFLVGSEPDVQRIPADSSALARGSPVFRAMFGGPLAPGGGGRASVAPAAGVAASTAPVVAAKVAPGSPRRHPAPPKSTVVVSDVDGRAFDILLR